MGSRAAATEPWFVYQSRIIPLAEGEHVIGREVKADIQLGAHCVSRKHARVRVEGGRATIEDIGSKNGTFVRGARIAGPTGLCDGDEVRFGTCRLIFRGPSLAAESTSSAQRQC